MKQFWNILCFEFKGYLKNKIFIGITIALITIVAIVLSVPRVGTIFQKEEKPSETEEQETLLLWDGVFDNAKDTLALFREAFPDKIIEITAESQVEVKGQIQEGTVKGCIFITSPTEYTFIVNKLQLYDNTTEIIDDVLMQKYRVDKLTEFGVPAEKTEGILTTGISSNIVQIGKDQQQTFFYTYILLFALYIAILLYGQLVASGVASEKSSRAMEMLITSANPNSLMFGKVIGSGLAGLMQMSLVLGSSFIFYNINRTYWSENAIVKSIFDMPISILLFTILFFVLGFFIYAFLFGAIGSLASKVEDISASTMPIMLIFIAAFMAVIISMSSGNVDNGLMIFLSYFPLTSPMAMFVRIAMGSVKSIEIIASVIVLIASTIGIGHLSARIYRIGVLLYGTPPKIKNILKAIKK